MLFYTLNLVLIVMVYMYSRIKKSIIGNEDTKIGDLLVFLSLWLISGVRSFVGTDFTAYKNYFDILNYYSLSYHEYEIGYYLLNYLVRLFTNDAQYLFLITSFIVIFLTTRTLKEYSVSYMLSIFLFITLYFYYNSFNILRQYIAVSIVFYSVRYILRDNSKKYILTILIASLFHNTSLIMIPFYWLLKMKISNIRYFVLFLLSIVLSFITPNLISLISKIIPGLSSYVNYYSEGASANSVIIITLSILIFSLVNKKNILAFDENSKIYINCIFFTLFFAVLSNNNIMFFRVASYFYIFVIILIPICIKVINKRLRPIISLLLILMMTIYHYYLLSSNTGGVLPYYVNLDFINGINPYYLLIIVIIVLLVLFNLSMIGLLNKKYLKKNVTS